jgi:Uma2 family endonuclease
MIQARQDLSDDVLYEVIDGVYVEKRMGLLESRTAFRLAILLEAFCQANRIGHIAIETLFEIPHSDNDRKPDVAFVSFERWAAEKPTPRVNAWPVAPDLAVEVISPTDKAFDVLEKVHEYFAGGVRQVWHVYSHTEQVFVFDSPNCVRVFNRDDEITAEPVVPGFRAIVSNLFPLAEPRK